MLRFMVPPLTGPSGAGALEPDRILGPERSDGPAGLRTSSGRGPRMAAMTGTRFRLSGMTRGRAERPMPAAGRQGGAG